MAGCGPAAAAALHAQLASQPSLPDAVAAFASGPAGRVALYSAPPVASGLQLLRAVGVGSEGATAAVFDALRDQLRGAWLLPARAPNVYHAEPPRPPYRHIPPPAFPPPPPPPTTFPPPTRPCLQRGCRC